MTPTKITAATPVVRQYYYRANGCTATHPGGPSCICWHDEGTGPFADGKDMEGFSWRDKPPSSPGETTGGEQLLREMDELGIGISRDPLKPAQSQTPMTDAVTKGCKWNGVYSELVAHAESLETALAAAKERVGELERKESASDGEWATLMADVHDYFKDERADRGHGRVRLVLTLLGQLRCDRDALAEKLRRCEANAAKFELAVCEFAHGLEGNEGDDDPLTVIRFYVDDLRTRLAALQQQVGEADKLAAKWEDAIAQDARVIGNPEATERGGVMERNRLMTVNGVRTDMLKELRSCLARQPDQRQPT